MKFRTIKGTKDILPDETAGWQYVESIIRRVMQNFNYQEIRTPAFEQTGLFARSIGELTDIVSKEMYTFLDRSEESITLRPEGTAATLRAYLQNNLGEQSPLTKVYYIGPMFRQERPQAGRMRQFHQFGAEAIGASSPQLDVEMMVLPIEIYKQLGIDQYSLKINSVGCEQCRPAYKQLLQTELRKIFAQLSHDSQIRVEQNPLRVLDSKDEKDRALTAGMPLMNEHLCEECAVHFASVRSLLDALNFSYEVDGRLVRGLDYYTKTAFEITSTALGSQDALAGGGRYDLLVEELGGKQTPGVGFAAGIERLLIVLAKLNKNKFSSSAPVIYFVGLDETARIWTFSKASELRRQGICAEVDYLGRSVKSQMREANRQQAQYVIVVGEQELKTKIAKLKNMQTGVESTVLLDKIEIPS
ncbi:MAG: histidine--tRNA ligase [Ignavibacteriales bacterium]|nr:histidine--tRNA ligase [Ignavibacteriales bacterium]